MIEWHPGDPMREGRYLVLLDIEGFSVEDRMEVGRWAEGEWPEFADPVMVWSFLPTGFLV